MKTKTNAYVLVVSAVALLMTTMLFKEGPLLVVAASPGPQHDTSVPTPPTSHKNSNVRSSVKAAAAGGRQLHRGDGPSGPRHNPLLVLASPQPNPNVPTPHNPLLVLASPQSNTNVPTLASPQPNPNVPTPHNPLLVLASPQPNTNVPTPASPQPNPNVPTPHNPLLLLASPQPNPNVPTPPKQRPVQSSAAVRHARCSPRPSCEPNVPTPGCCNPKSKKEQQVKLNGKAEIIRNYQNSINAGKHA